MAQEMGMLTATQTIGLILCCKCGIQMQPNAANMCTKCLRSEVDITEDVRKHFDIIHCPECDHFLQPPNTWVKAQLESKELLIFCLKRLKLVNKVRLVHAEFIWTEPHSKRIRVQLKVQKEVINGAILEQACTVEYVVRDEMCGSCQRINANPDQWVTVVQLRQHVSHRRTFFFLEQLILKHDAVKYAVRINQVKQGIDFFFNKQSHGDNFVDFLGKVSPIKVDEGKKLVSHDTKSNKSVYKYSISVEICPICREDLICLPPKVAVSLGNLGPLVICNKVSNRVALLDPFTLRQSLLSAEQYWRASFIALMSSKQLVEYIVLDVEPVSSQVCGLRYALADAQVARLSDFGKNDRSFNVRTHLGHLLSVGDYVLGYDLYGANMNDMELDKYKGLVLPDAVLIKKSYGDKTRKRGTLNSTKMDIHNEDYQLFSRQLADNPDSVFNVSLYSDGEVDGDDVSLTLVDEFEDLDLDDDDDNIMKE